MTAVLDKLVFVGDDPYEQYRAKTLWTKEPGTIHWLRQNCREGDVVYDIGANIGCYTLVAAQLVGERGRVYAFEPHVGNAHSLLRNIEANGLQDRVRVVTAALSEDAGFNMFGYGSLRAGSSHSHFGQHASNHEVKYATTLEQFSALYERPALMKIDVDGNELSILRGAGLLRGPRSVQVEMPPVDAAAIDALMQSYGYVNERIHYTANGQQQIEQGADPSRVIHNAIFRKAD